MELSDFITKSAPTILITPATYTLDHLNILLHKSRNTLKISAPRKASHLCCIILVNFLPKFGMSMNSYFFIFLSPQFYLVSRPTNSFYEIFVSLSSFHHQYTWYLTPGPLKSSSNSSPFLQAFLSPDLSVSLHSHPKTLPLLGESPEGEEEDPSIICHCIQY